MSPTACKLQQSLLCSICIPMHICPCWSRRLKPSADMQARCVADCQLRERHCNALQPAACPLLCLPRQVVNTNLLFANPFPEGRAIAIYNQSAQLVRADDLSVVPPSEVRTRASGIQCIDVWDEVLFQCHVHAPY